MKGLDGLELQNRLNQSNHLTPVIFLTGHGDIPMSVEAMKSGAQDFLTKPVDESVLLKSLERAFLVGGQRREEDQRKQSVLQRIALLSPREREVMGCLITGALNKQIAAHLGIVEKTVKVHRARVLKKMNTPSIAELVRLCTVADVEAIDCQT